MYFKMLRLPIHVPNKFSHNDDNCYDHDDDDIRIPTEYSLHKIFAPANRNFELYQTLKFPSLTLTGH